MVDFVLFNLCWIANAFSGMYSLPYLGPLTVLLSGIIHLTLVNEVGAEITFLGIASVIGYLWDTILLRLGLLKFPAGSPVNYAPIWLFAQWIAFGFLFRHTIRWLRNRPVLGLLLGATGGSLSYYSATGLGVLSLSHPVWQPLLVMALGWGLIVPAFGSLSHRLEKKNFNIF